MTAVASPIPLLAPVMTPLEDCLRVTGPISFQIHNFQSMRQSWVVVHFEVVSQFEMLKVIWMKS